MASRAQFLRGWLERRGDQPIDEAALRTLQAELQSALGPAADRAAASPQSLLRLAESLHALGGRVSYGDLGGGAEDRVLSLQSLASVEAGLHQLQRCLEKARAAGDSSGVERARMAARRARRRALRVAANPRVGPAKRQEKQEMADWLLIWLEMPEAFFEWLPLRQAACELASSPGIPGS